MQDLSTPVLVTLGVLIVVQALLLAVALVDLARRPTARVVGANKWIWLAVILLVSTIGPILYLAAGRRAASDPTAPTTAMPGTVRPQDVADALYGPDRGAGPR